MNKEDLLDIICQSQSDYDIINNAYNYIDKLEKENKKLKDYKSRNKKAIEHIEEILPGMDVKYSDVIKLKDTFWGKDLLEVLKGEKNE